MTLTVRALRSLHRCLQPSCIQSCKTHVKQLVISMVYILYKVISMVYILCCRGQGVGSAVVKHLLETPAAMTTNVYLITLGRSIPFYKKAGFTLVPIRQIPRCVLCCSLLWSFRTSCYCLLVHSFIHPFKVWCLLTRLKYIQSCLTLVLAACAHMHAAACVPPEIASLSIELLHYNIVSLLYYQVYSPHCSCRG